jgi:soluble lytic murein transglycosylase-like protein
MRATRSVLSLTLLFALGLPPGAQASATPSLADLETPAPGRVSVANKRKLKPMIDGVAKKRGVDQALVHAVIAAESGYDPRAVSPKGAIGLMQVMPDTAGDYGVAAQDDLFDPKTNVEVGTRHLKRLLGRYKNIRHAVMAYNAGEGAFERTQGAAYRETRLYAFRVINNYWRNKGGKPIRLRELEIGGPWRPKLRIESTVKNLDPGLHSIGPETKPIFLLESQD